MCILYSTNTIVHEVLFLEICVIIHFTILNFVKSMRDKIDMHVHRNKFNIIKSPSKILIITFNIYIKNYYPYIIHFIKSIIILD